MRKDDVLASKDYVTADDLIDKPLISSRRGMIQNEIFMLSPLGKTDFQKILFDFFFF